MDLHDEIKPTFQSNQWRIQRVLWVVGAVIIVLALIGIFGDGPLTGAEKSREANGITYELGYDRWNRQDNPQRLTASLEGPDLSGREFSIVLSEGFASDVSISLVTPDPDSTSLSEEGPVFTWILDTGERFSASFAFSADSWLDLNADVTFRVEGSDPQTLSFSQFLFP
jgi:hypothetical protein